MKSLTGLFFVVLISVSLVNAQSINSEKAATHFYIVNLDNELLDILNQTNAKGKLDAATMEKTDMVASIIDSVYNMSSQVFKSDLGLELLPLNELQSKIKYNSEFPNCPNMVNIKKVLKTASGYKYYADYFVNIFSGLNPDSQAKPSLNQIRPLYAISFTLYDGTGKIVKKMDFSYKSKKPLADNKKDAAKTNEEIKSKICSQYNLALNEFTAEYKKMLIAKL